VNYSIWYNVPRLLSVGGLDCRGTDCVFGVKDVFRKSFTRSRNVLHTFFESPLHIRETSFTRSRNVLHTFEKRPSHVRETSFTRFSKVLHTFEKHPSHVFRKSFTRSRNVLHSSRNVLHTFEKRPSHVRETSFTPNTQSVPLQSRPPTDNSLGTYHMP